MKIYNRILAISAFMSCLTSCQEQLELPIDKDNTEQINGFLVHWRAQISEAQKDAARGILNDMVFVSGGCFVMGATPEQNGLARQNEYPNIYVKLSDYFICRYEVTDEQYSIITGEEISASLNDASRTSLSDWEVFISTLSDLTSISFALPTEAQWEYAARGGNRSLGYIYPGSNNIEDVRSTSFEYGSDTPNELGLYNMADLKSEWCSDYYSPYEWENRIIYNRKIVEGSYHVVRGGNYKCTEITDKYANKNDSPNSYYASNYSLSAYTTSTKKNLDYRHCRITSRSYAYETSQYLVGCRLVINVNSSLLQ
jgi:formylglycine-generating enzyme required for sulfatase activity